MIKLSLPTAAFFAFCISTSAAAELYPVESYIGGSVVGLEVSEAEADNDLSLLSANARFGAKFGNYAALEWRVGTGLDDDELAFAGEQGDINLDIFYGIYLLGGFPISEKIQPYALIGYTRAEFDVNTRAISSEGEESDISFGIGINIGLDNDFSLNAEYIRYIKESGVELSGPSLGVVYHF